MKASPSEDAQQGLNKPSHDRKGVFFATETVPLFHRRGSERSFSNALLSLRWGLSAVAVFVGISVGMGTLAHGDPRPAGDVGPQRQLERATYIGFSQIDELPPLPVGIEGDVEGQPTGVPIPIFRVISDEEMARGGTADGSATAIVFRQSYDSGYGRFMKSSDSGNFIANLLHLGNGFPLYGGQITGYDTMIYNSVSSPGGNAAATVSLWDGDPLGFVDTGSTGIPVQIPGTTCTFSDMEQAGLGAFCVGGVCEGGGFSDGWACTSDMDCGLCPGATGGTDDACPGLYFLSCDLGGKVDIPSRNVWMVIEWTAGCRMGWRLAIYAAPEIAAAGEENYCGNTCPDSPGPCVDMIFEYYDEASQKDKIGVGTCCEDDSIACDHTDCEADGTGCECGHPTSCGDGVATDEHPFCYGAPSYYASFVASIYTNTDTTISLEPVEVVHKNGTPVAGAVIDGNKVTIPSTATPANIYLNVMVAGWGGEGNATQIKTWQVAIDSSSYDSGIGEALTSPVRRCMSDAACGGLGATCEVDGVWAGFCAPAWQNCSGPWPGHNICLDLPSCNLSTPDYVCGSTSFGLAVTDPGVPSYGMSVAIRVPNGAKGTYSVGFVPQPRTFLINQNSMGIPLIAYIPAEITIPTGSCCVFSGEAGNFVCVGDGMSGKECFAKGGIFSEGGSCLDDSACDCTDDSQCDDGDGCTDDVCTASSVCVSTYNHPSTICCNDGTLCTIDDDNECTDDSCSGDNGRGDCVNTNVPDDTGCGEGGFTCFVEWCQTGVCTLEGVTGMACTGEGQGDCPDSVTNPNTACVAGVCECISCETNLSCDDPLACRATVGFDVNPSDKPNGACFATGEQITVDVNFWDSPRTIVGGQFRVSYDSSCISFNSIAPGGDPFVYEIDRDVDEDAGTIFYAVGVNPFGGVGVAGSGTLATIVFTKVNGCNNCSLTIDGVNPQEAVLTTVDGQFVCVDVEDSAEMHHNDKLSLDVPSDVKVNVDCDYNTAIVNWDIPTAGSSCEDADCDPQKEKCYDPDLDCYLVDGDGSHADPFTGGEFPPGIAQYCCTATSNICGDSVASCWEIDIHDQTQLDVTVQRSPIMVGEIERCIKFELFADCTQPPLVIEGDLSFGGPFDFDGHFTESIKIPDTGKWVCITARDQLHTLRAVSSLPCANGAYTAVFIGDPILGGNWLIGGNLDGWKKDNPNASHDVIDILDFGQFVAAYLTQLDPNTPCVTDGPHADINGDGIVDGEDFAFVTRNFLESSKDSCCPNSAAGATVGRTEVSVGELRQMGMNDLTVADLNRDGLVNGADIAAFLSGARPEGKTPRGNRTGSGLGSR